MNSVPCFPARLETPRLWLRRLHPGDAASIQLYRSLPEVARYQSWETFELDDAIKLIESQSGAEPGVAGTWFQLAIVSKDDDKVIGDCGLHCLEDGRQMEFGITLGTDHQGRGYATEAIRCLLDYVFGVLAMHRVLAVTGAENHAVAALFQRLGFRQEAHHVEHRWYKGGWESEFVFALLRLEWEAGGRDDG